MKADNGELDYYTIDLAPGCRLHGNCNDGMFDAMAQRSPMHLAYLGAITIKGLDGLIEAVAGLILTLVTSKQIYDFAIWATAPELARHPGNHTAHAIRHGAYGFAHSPHKFAIVYLLAHGLLKMGLAINLFIEHLWIFPVSAIVLLGFIVFMGVKLGTHWSPWLFAFAVFDTVTLVLVLNEWRQRRAMSRR